MTWGQRAACKDKASAESDPWFSPEDDDDNYSEESTWIARSICHNLCEVRETCLEYAIETGQQYGIWGGLDPKERRKLVLDRARGLA